MISSKRPFLYEDLKPSILIRENLVECPVRGCSISVPRQRRVFRREKQFQCPAHGIYISPTTFEYEHEKDNLICKDGDDLDHLEIGRAHV